MPRPNCPRRVRMRGRMPWFVPVYSDPLPPPLPMTATSNRNSVAQDRFLQEPSSSVELTLDELEAIRLADYEDLYQEAAARSMGISRQTFGRIIQQAHRKIAEAVLFGKILKIQGGPVRPLEEE